MSAARRRAAGLLAAWLGAAAVWAAPAEQADPDPGLLERMRRGFEIAPESETETRALLAVLAETRRTGGQLGSHRSCFSHRLTGA